MHLGIKWFEFYAQLPIQSLVFIDKRYSGFFFCNFLTKSSHPDSKVILVTVAKLLSKKKNKHESNVMM